VPCGPCALRFASSHRVVVAYLFDMLMRWVEYKLVPWKGRM
jgi:hypothetical protein